MSFSLAVLGGCEAEKKEAPAGVGAQRSAARGAPRGPHNALWGLRRLEAAAWPDGRAEAPPPDTNRSLLSPLHYFTFVGLHSSFAQKHGLSCSSGRAVCHLFLSLCLRASTKSPLTFGCESAAARSFVCACHATKQRRCIARKAKVSHAGDFLSDHHLRINTQKIASPCVL